MFQSKRVAVDDSRDLIVDGNEASEALVCNRDDLDSVYVGGPDVTAANGYELKPGDALRVALGSRNDDLHGVCAATDSVDLHILLSG